MVCYFPRRVRATKLSSPSPTGATYSLKFLPSIPLKPVSTSYGISYIPSVSNLDTYALNLDASNAYSAYASWHDYSDYMNIACGKCLGCRTRRSRDWSLRCQHEMRYHSESCFLTLTFDNDHLPEDRSLDVSYLQKFMKRVRKMYSNVRIRYFACGEYGSRRGRPHYHLILFGLDFHDKLPWYQTNSKDPVFTSPTVSKLWPFGLNVIGAATKESAGYIARYTFKKRGSSYYEAKGLKSEFIVMSRRPGIGFSFFEEYSSDMFPSDFISCDGKKLPVPSYYFRCLKKFFPSLFKKVYEKRLAFIKDTVFDPEFYRNLYKGYVVAHARASQFLVRPFEAHT